MLRDVVASLECPVCSHDLELADGIVRCDEGHCFDVAREGYVNLSTGGARASTADSASMVAARRLFLEGGHFRPIMHAIVDAVRAELAPTTPGIVVDAAGGTGAYLKAVLDALPQRAGVVLDASKHAAKLAARAHTHAAAVVTDVWGTLPLKGATCAVLLSVFGPRNAEEFARILNVGGTLLVVAPRKAHLAELTGPLGLISIDSRKRQRLADKLAPSFVLMRERPLEYLTQMTRAQAVSAALMGPSAVHISEGEFEIRAARMPDSVSVTVSVDVMAFALREDPRIRS